MPTLLIIDDEKNVRYSLERGLRSENLLIETAATAREGIEQVAAAPPDAVLLDVRLPDLSGLEVLEEIRQIEPHLPVIIMTAHGTANTAIEAMKRGAFDYILKPWQLGELRALVDKALDAGRISRIPALFDAEVATGEERVDRIIGASPTIQTVFKEIGRIAPQDVNVLILGESGTGKELVARAIYHHSRRAAKPFLAINCAAIPETLLESELFGHEQGAFTGAERRRIGKFEQADGGTLFLDEIGDMSPITQAKILRILQDGRFERVGGNTTLAVDVRIVAATNRNLDEAIRQKAFRQDLFYRLNTFTLHLPPLRERLDDLPLLVEFFVKRFQHELEIEIRGVTPATMQVLERHSWPGNIRELESAIKYAIVHATGDVLTPESLPASVRHETLPTSEPVMPSEIKPTADDLDLSDVRRLVQRLLAEGESNLNDAVRAVVDRIVLEEVLNHVGGHQTKAAEILGLSRTTLRTRLQQLGLSVEKSVQSE